MHTRSRKVHGPTPHDAAAMTAPAEGVTARGQKYLYFAAASFELVYIIIYFIILVEKP